MENHADTEKIARRTFSRLLRLSNEVHRAFFLKKLDLKATEGQNLGALSADFPDHKVAIEETKEEADALGADVFELESDKGSIRQRWELNDGQCSRQSRTSPTNIARSMPHSRCRAGARRNAMRAMAVIEAGPLQ